MLYSMEPEKNKVSRVNSFFIKKWFGYRVVMLFYGEFQVVVIVCRGVSYGVVSGEILFEKHPVLENAGHGVL